MQPVGWVEPCETHHSSSSPDDGYRFAPPILRAVEVAMSVVLPCPDWDESELAGASTMTVRIYSMA